MSFIEARLTNQSVPRAREVPVAAGQAFEVGALGALVAGEFTEAAGVPAVGTVTYVSQTPFGVGGERNTLMGRREFPPGKAVVTDAFVTTFRCEFAGDLPAAPGSRYAPVRGTDGRWRINFAAVVGAGALRYLGPVSDLPGTTVPRLVEVEFVRA